MPSEAVTSRTTKTRSWTTVAIAVLALAIAIGGLFLPTPLPTNVHSPTVQKSTLNQITERGVLRVGYELYPPYTILEPESGKLTGFSVDLTAYIAKEAGWEVEWVRTTADTKIPDIQAGKFDVMTEPIFQTIARATRVGFTDPYSYFGDSAGIVRKGETRFSRIEDVNKTGITVAVRQGYTNQAFAIQNLPKATIRAVKVDDASQLFLEVVTGKADIALADLAQVKAFVAAHSGEVEARFVAPPPSSIPAGFMYRQGDFVFGNFLNSAIRYAESNGIIKGIKRKYDIADE